MSETVLHAAAREGDIKTLTQALKSNRDVNATDADGMTALHYAAWYGFVQGCLALIASGTLVNKFDHDGATPLHAAAFNGQLACAIVLVDEGADVLITDNDNFTAAEQAAREGHTEISNLLRSIETETKAQSELKRLEAAYTEAKEKAKTASITAQKTLKDAKKLAATLEKNAQKEAKKTIKARKAGKEVKEVRPPLPQVAKATSFSQLAGMPVAPIVQPVSQKPNMRRGVSAGNVMPSTAPAPTSSKRPSDDTAFAPLPTATLRRPTNEAPVDARKAELAADMLIAELTADQDEDATIETFLIALDLAEFSRIFDGEGVTLEDLRQCSADELKMMGIPAGARKKIIAALHPDLF